LTRAIVAHFRAKSQMANKASGVQDI